MLFANVPYVVAGERFGELPELVGGILDILRVEDRAFPISCFGFGLSGRYKLRHGI